jgi:hypothetical protein
MRDMQVADDKDEDHGDETQSDVERPALAAIAVHVTYV